MYRLRPVMRPFISTTPRRFATEVPPKPKDSPNSFTRPGENGGLNMPLIVGTLAILGGGWYYMTRTDKERNLKDKENQRKERA